MSYMSRFLKSLQILKTIGFDIALWRFFLKTNCRYGNIRGCQISFMPLSDTKVQVGEDCQVSIDGKLTFGYQLLKGARQCTRLLLANNASFCVLGNYVVRAGSYIRIEPNSKLTLHSGFMNENVQIICGDSIDIGEDTVIGNDTIIRSDDGHQIVAEGYRQSEPIRIGKHVWIGQRVQILKGVSIGDGCIIAAGAIVSKDIPARCLAAGVPARVIRENVDWKS